jgi:type II secretion system protein J
MKRREGFTLVEMLIVIGITALLVTAAVQAHLSIRRAQARAGQGLLRDRSAEVLLDRLESELFGAVLVVRPGGTDRLSHPYVFFGEDAFTAEADADAIRFVTRSPARAAPTAGRTGLRLVTYVAEANDEEGTGMTLVREEEPLPDGLEKEPIVEEAQAVLEGVALFRLQYLDYNSGAWRDWWDSTDVRMLDDLPSSVEIAVALLEENDLGELQPGPEHGRVVLLPVRPFDLEALRELAGLEGEEDPNEPEGGEDGEDDEEECRLVRECSSVPASHPNLVGFSQYFSECYDRSHEKHKMLKAVVELGGGTWYCD